MKKKLLSVLLALCGAFAFTACGGGDGDSVVLDNNSTPAASIPTDSTPADTTPAEPVLQDMDTAFSGAKILWEKSHLSAMNSPIKTFEEIVDRQLELLAQDLIYRLTYVYGYNETVPVRQYIPVTQPLMVNGTELSWNGYPAEIESGKLLVNTGASKHDVTHTVSTMHVDCLYCYQTSLVEYNNNANRFHHTSNFYLSGAMEGRYYSAGALDNDELSDTSVPEKKWIYSLDITTYESYLNSYKNNFKMALLEIAGNKTVTGDYSDDVYQNLLQSVNTFFIDETKVAEYILSKVIGSNLVEFDEAVYAQNFTDAANKICRSKFGDIAIFGEYAPHYYKAYKKVIPAIVEQALANTFENTDVCIYPVVNRYAVNTINHYQIGGSSTMREAVLMPKAGEVGTLTVFVEGSEDFTLSYDVSVNGVVTSKTVQVVLTDGKATLDLDISETFGAYNGNTNSYTDDYIYGNSGVDSHGDNYIVFYYDREDMHLWFKGVK